MQYFRGRKNSVWLESLEGESSLLSSQQWNFVSDVCSLINSTMPIGDISPATRRVVQQDLPGIVGNFTHVVAHLKASTSARRQFLETYLGWKDYRGKTIAELNKIADSIDKNKENCEVAKILSSGLSLFGGGLCLLADERDKKKEESTSQKVGSIMMGLGNLAIAGTSAVGAFLLHENIESAKKTLREDREYIKELWTWIQDTGDLLKSLDTIKSSISIDGRLQTVVKSLREVSRNLSNSRSAQADIQMILKSINCPRDLRNGISDLVGILVSTHMLCDRYHPLIKIATEEGTQCLPRLRFAVDLYQSASGLDRSLAVHRSGSLTLAQRRRRVFDGMIEDASNIASVVLEMDTQSVESQKVRQAVYALEEEADSFERLYDAMTELNFQEYMHRSYYQ